MVRTRKVKDELAKAKQKRDIRVNKTTADNFFLRKKEKVEKEAKEKEQQIKDMEKREAELLDKIKKTQGIQLKEFGKLEEAIYEQQIGVRQRL